MAVLNFNISANDNKEDQEFDSAFYKALKDSCYLFPDSDDELDKFIEKAKNCSNPIPKEFDDPLSILKRGLLEFKNSINSSTDSELEENGR